MDLFIQSLVDQACTAVRQNAAMLIAELDPLIADRIASVFPDADPEVMEPSTLKFTDTLVEILPGLLNTSECDKSLKMLLLIALVPLQLENMPL